MLLAFTNTRAQLWGRDGYYNSRWNFGKEYDKARKAGGDLNYFLRSELAIGYIACPITLTQYEREDSYDTTIKTNLTPNLPIQWCATTGYPLRNVSDNAAWILTYGVDFRITVFPNAEIKSGYSGNTAYSGSFFNTDMGVPLSIDYKSGAEANLDRAKRTCFTLGAGIEPIWINGQLSALEYSNITLKPFFKTEFGMLMGSFLLKLRASVVPGTYRYFRFANEYSTFGSEIEVAGQSPFVLSFVINPMAGKWGE